jgi:hypothetical protein
MKNSERKRKAAEEHNKQYCIQKARLSKMTNDEIEKEKISRSASRATSELIPQANKILEKQ